MAVDRERFGWQRLADVQVPRGILWVVLVSLLIRQRRMAAAVDDFGLKANELAEYLGNSWRETQEREEQLVQLQASIQNLTRWLVLLTVALGLFGLAGIGASVWAALS